MHKKIEQLFSTNSIKGKFCELHHIDLDDAGLIYDLRNRKKDNFLRATPGTIDDQRKYLHGYFERFAKREEIYYKILDRQTGKFSGVLRFTEILDNRVFNWQSFVVAENSSPNVPLDAMLMVYRIGFEFLEREICGPWNVDRDFVRMIRIHDFIKMAKIVGEHGKYFLFVIKRSDYQNNINKFLKMGYAKLAPLL
ncbi:MAG: hypothetical protein A2887_06720 [Alphaproteobacteria bacterium RIFCSPLOWO2_01_FULL_40_26]|nr:MAG: hypothetical protein A2887_06720 [Alphaproteobacteria bacterium RIFCSPLOWO2_01_FULL_40_26]OFX10039.1 MAG: hypothetical protein A3H30_04435 [Alphaproteobacteria bacterium RIFCSPLOWO2_02_FULL_40_19]OFX11673.1 MAG: hypothetical protein A3G22_04030 [Alphaproteobacteria bacterium RIFCSPLOWO2_12_FULL_40_11]